MADLDDLFDADIPAGGGSGLGMKASQPSTVAQKKAGRFAAGRFQKDQSDELDLGDDSFNFDEIGGGAKPSLAKQNTSKFGGADAGVGSGIRGFSPAAAQ